MAPERGASDTRSMPASARLIALLDDEEDFRKALSRLLKAHGYQVASFATGEELMAEVPTAAFGCVLLDLNMPGMSGFDVLAELEAELQPPPVIVLSANDDPAGRLRNPGSAALGPRNFPSAHPVILRGHSPPFSE